MVYHDIICPVCFKSFKVNNVVFRASRMREDLKVDLYIRNFQRQLGNDYSEYTKDFLDPALLSPNYKKYQNGRLEAVIDPKTGERTTERLCPYCHAKLYENAGTRHAEICSVLGFTKSGKTVYLAALKKQLEKTNIGVINGSNDHTIEENIRLLEAGEKISSTTDYSGPYVYHMTSYVEQKEIKNTILFYDIPGERFKNYDEIRKRAAFIEKSNTCIFLVDIENVEGAIQVFNNIATNYLEGGRKLDMDLCMVLSKSDQLEKEFPSAFKALALQIETNYVDGKPINYSEIDYNSNYIRKNIIEKDTRLNGLAVAVDTVVKEERCRWFTVRSMNGETFSPKNCVQPFLWAMARKSYYPSKTE